MVKNKSKQDSKIPPVIIALDFQNRIEAMEFLGKFTGEKLWVKIGMELFYKEGSTIIEEIKKIGHKIFLDLKLHDIPNTVKKAMINIGSLDIDMCTVHAAGSIAMMMAAKEGLEIGISNINRDTKPILIAVSQLTSIDDNILSKELLIDKNINDVVIHYGENAKKAGLDGLVCSPLESELIHKKCGKEFLTITPGIRFEDEVLNDQRRVTSPAKAQVFGSNFIVIGRPITQAQDPVAAYHRAVEEFCYEPNTNKIAKGLLDIGAVFLRPDQPFTWASGIKSPIYCDNRLILTAPKVRKIVEHEIVNTIKNHYPDCETIMGTSTAGIPHAAIVANILDLPMGYVRGAAKEHGRGSRIEGKLDKGTKVVVIEDLISTGASAIETVKALEEAGAKVLGIASIFTYAMTKGIERLKAEGIKNVSLCNLDFLVQTAIEEGYIREVDGKRILLFRERPDSNEW